MKFQEPTFVASVLCFLLLVLILLFDRFSPSREAIRVEEFNAAVTVMKTAMEKGEYLSAFDSFRETEIDDAVSMAKSALDKGEYQTAFDMILVASRLSPSSPRLFDLVEAFVNKSKQESNESVAAMADELLDRSTSLVYFQSPKEVTQLRKRLTDLQNSVLLPSSTSTEDSSLESIRQLIKVANNESLPISVRTDAIENSRAALNDYQLDSAIKSIDSKNIISPDEINQVSMEISDAENKCILILYSQSNSKVDSWLQKVAEVVKIIDSTSIEKSNDESVKSAISSLKELLPQGFDLEREIVPFQKSGIEEAKTRADFIRNQLDSMQRKEIWVYNQQSLKYLREIETRENTPELTKLGWLALVDENKLSPYVSGRFNKLWDTMFENLANEADKVEATKYRVLKTDLKEIAVR